MVPQSLCFMVISLLITAAAAADVSVVEVDDSPFRLRLNRHIRVLRDHSGTMGIEGAVEAAEQGLFTSLPGNRLNQGIDRAPMWVQFSVKNNNLLPQTLALSADDPNIDEIQFYVSAADGKWTKTTVFEGVRQPDLMLQFRKPVIEITIPGDTVQSYFIRTIAPLEGYVLAFTLSDLKSFMSFENLITMFSGILFGAVLFFDIHFLKLAIRLKERTELWFAINLSSFSWYYAIRSGYAQDILPSLGPGFFNLLHFVLLGLCFFTGLKLFREYLDIRTVSIRLDNILMFLQWAALANVPFVYLKSPFAVLPGILIFSAIPLITFHWSVRLWVKGSIKARYFTIGWFGYALFFSIDLLILIGAVPWHPMAFGLLPAAIIWTLFFFPDAIVWKFFLYKSQSIVDGLTDLSNRRYFDIRLKSEWNLCLRTSNPISLLLIDIDRFKNYNDRYGHSSGDDCLKSIAAVIRDSALRISDNAFRYGGEEFAVILSGTSEEGAFKVAKSIQINLKEAGPVRNDEFGPRVTVSIGINTIQPGIEHRIDELIENADSSLYMAKELGRDRICVYNKNQQHTDSVSEGSAV